MSALATLWRDYLALPEVQFLVAHWKACLVLILGIGLLATILFSPSQWRRR